MDRPARVVVINGASSSGKTSLGRAVQSLLSDQWLLLGLDTYLTALPFVHGGPDGLTIHPGGVVTRGPRFLAEYDRWRHAVAELARRGSNVLIDEVFLDGGDDQELWAAALAGLDVVWVGLRCAPDVAARREADRGDRNIGLARHQSATVHVEVHYDIELDSSHTDTTELAVRLIARLTA